MNRYNNYHKHDHISSIMTPDSNTHMIEYINRAIELNELNVFTTNHGTGGDIFEAKSLCDSNNINCKFGMEGYIVPNPLERDKSNYHIVLIPKTNVARKKLNKANSRANKEGYYYKPRLFLDDLLNNFDSNELYITTACVAGLLRDDDSINKIFYPLYEKFGKNLMLEVQNHPQDIQVEINKKALKCHNELGLYLIGANDSHYIYPQQQSERLELLKGKGIFYDDEDSFILDYPDYDTMVGRFQQQGVLSNAQILQAMENTLIFDECENIQLNKDIKMPTIYPNLNEDEKIQELKNIVNEKFIKVMSEDNISKEKRKDYIQEVQKEMQVIEDTKEIHTSDYFLFNNKMIELAVNEYGGVLTKTGRGSCGAYLINKILGITQIDRLATTLPIYSERFISSARLLENRAIPDIDMNIATQEPFVKATRELLGDNGCYPMIAYGTMKESESFRNICRSAKLNYDEYNEVAKNIDNYRNDIKWKKYIEESQKYVGTIVSASVHPCAHILLNEDIEEEIGVVKIGDAICAMITSNEADEWKYLKNDYLIVSVWDIIDATFKLIGKPILTIKQLIERLDGRVWGLFEKGMTCTLNQVDGDWATHLLKIFKPHNVEDLSMFVGAIRPSFDNFRDDFINHRPYTTGSKDLDNILKPTKNRVLFQENLMQYFEWLSVTPSESIGLIKKISKKKIKPKDFKDLEERIKEQWIINTGSIDRFQETWESMQSMMGYGFNCVSGNTKIFRNHNNKFEPTVEEMYYIMNHRDYAKQHNHLSLYKKYRHNGYGKTLSLFDDIKLHGNEIVNISYAGVRDIYMITTKSNKTIECTDNHKFPTPNGKIMLKDLKIGDKLYCMGEYQKNTKTYNLTDGNFEDNLPKKGEQGFQKKPNGVSVMYDNFRDNAINNELCCEICDKPYSKHERFEVHHKDLDRYNNETNNFQWLCVSCHKKEHYKNGRLKKYQKGIPVYLDEIISIEYVRNDNVYDISMNEPAHNFVVNDGIITSNSPHGYATALDCLYGAYLKVNYPLEYYSVVLNKYQSNTEKTARLLKEIEYFGIKLSNIKFRYSSDKYGFDKDKKLIYKSISSIKSIGKQVGSDLYALKDNTYLTFFNLLIDLKSTSINKTALNILTKLDFFSEFGDINTLLYQTEIYNKFATSKVITKSKLSPYELNCLQGCYGKETKSQYRELDNVKFMQNLIANADLQKATDYEKVGYELKYLGYSNIILPNEPNNICGVANVDIDQWNRPWVTLYRLCDGYSDTVKVDKKWFNDNKCGQGDILRCAWRDRAKMRKVGEDNDGKNLFEYTGEFEDVLKVYSVLN